MTYIKSRVKRYLLAGQKELQDFWHTHSGDWHWLNEKPMPLVGLTRRLWRSSIPSFSFCFMLMLSSVISTLGLLSDSAATIIGAMIIAPLMGPIISVAYATIAGNRRLLRRSLLTSAIGAIITIFTSLITIQLVGLEVVGSEVMARANPSLIDLGVALAAGAAGGFANSRRTIADTLPGVAIAVALVPPLSTVGIGLALGYTSLAGGALLLFATNFTGIIFSGGLVFLCQGYGNIKRAKRGLSISILILLVLGIPLAFSLQNLLVKENVRRNVGNLLRRQTLTFDDADIRYIRVQEQEKALVVEVEVAMALGSISELQVELVRDFLSRELERNIDLRVRVIPVQMLSSPKN
ncbi:DUF389 domain-containing protein [Oscillatoriales cyanobacterium LEGE 11467]|uniref:DUF389 domain-containing protein n=1 Tax=Zarconia navalis LEGE 11467 TaxID=1828826 RepID=A0A928Z881_9CYAN|nr:DUF389 domain-containing protein [Zarconia navalis]MBE9039566.1 DUF389 domain-containing protein [Zarconia navalis LEGE 11467]